MKIQNECFVRTCNPIIILYKLYVVRITVHKIFINCNKIIKNIITVMFLVHRKLSEPMCLTDWTYHFFVTNFLDVSEP